MGFCAVLGVIVLAALPAILPRLSQSFPIPYMTTFNFNVDMIPNMAGKVIVVTGGNSGLGYVSAREMANKGAKVIIGCRSEGKAKEAIAKMRQETANPALDVTFMPLVLDDLASVDSFAKQFKATHSRVDVLMNNAGKLFGDFQLTKQGFESNLGVHHVGHFMLTHRLMSSLEATSKPGAPTRIVQVSSHAHQHCETIDFEHSLDPQKYSAFGRYSESKLANILFAREVAKRLEAKSKNVIINSNHPGMVVTDFSWFQQFFVAVAYSMDGGALTQLHLATSPEFSDYHITGQYYYPVGVQARYGIETSSAAHDEALQTKLWEWTVTKLKSYDPDFQSL